MLSFLYRKHYICMVLTDVLSQYIIIMVTIHHIPELNIFRAEENDKEVGRIEYDQEEQAITITHTYAYIEGCGIGRQLVVAVIEYAKENGCMIIPQCSYARVLMNKSEAYRQLIAEEAND